MAKLVTGAMEPRNAAQVAMAASNSPTHLPNVGLAGLAALAIFFLTLKPASPSRFRLNVVLARVRAYSPTIYWKRLRGEGQAANFPVLWASQAISLSLTGLAMSATAVVVLQLISTFPIFGESGGRIAFFAAVGFIFGVTPAVYARVQEMHFADLQSTLDEQKWLALCLLPSAVGMSPLLLMFFLTPEEIDAILVWSTAKRYWLFGAIFAETWACLAILAVYGQRIAGQAVAGVGLAVSIGGGPSFLYFGWLLESSPIILWVGLLLWVALFGTAVALKVSIRATRLYQ
jgi:hypothetical protein